MSRPPDDDLPTRERRRDAYRALLGGATEVQRRELLRLMGAAFALSGATGCTRAPPRKILPYVEQPPDVLPGVPSRYATALSVDGYGVGVLGCPLVVVLGHEGCGAVAAAIEVVERNATFPGAIGDMIEPIVPAALAARGQPGDRLNNAVIAHARRTAARLPAQSPILGEAVRAGRLRIVAARCDLDEGHVTWMEAA